MGEDFSNMIIMVIAKVKVMFTKGGGAMRKAGLGGIIPVRSNQNRNRSKSSNRSRKSWLRHQL